ncbi:hypothetical protein LAT59_05040 [Candidatus Gracilibacteria bacterium]|nr:hypothetical protein [Candidatus Gracilibacteria bacterium]
MNKYLVYPKSILGILIGLFLIGITLTQVSAAINFTVTPIRYELQIQPGGSITETASIRNNGSTPVTLGTTVSDFETRDYSGTPKIVRRSELVFPEQQLSSWISLSEGSITLEPGEEKSVEFTIDVPTDATPGGHYGAVLFKHDRSQASSQGNVGIDVDYGVILLVEVAGDIIIDIKIEEPLISNKVGYGYGSFGPDSPIWNFPISQDPASDGWFLGQDDEGTSLYQLPDSCPFGDLSGDRFDGKCFPWEPSLFQDQGLNFSTDGFEIQFSFPLENMGNTHVRPTGKITLRDENDRVIGGVGKEAMANDFGAVIGERVVDYIPINDEQGNILPNSRRVYDAYWKGFPYQDFDEQGNIVIKYWTPTEYYSRLGQRESGYLMPWEIVTGERTRKNITADIELRYKDIEGNDIVFNSAKEFPIQYVQERIILNPYILIGLFLLIPIILMLAGALWWWIIIKREKKCWNCGEKIKAHWKTCPYCQAIQDKKSHENIEKLIKNATGKKSEKKNKKKKS